MQNLRDCFVVFFLLMSQNHNFVKVKGLKLQLSQTLYLKQIALGTKYQWNKQNQNRMERLINYVKH